MLVIVFMIVFMSEAVFGVNNYFHYGRWAKHVQRLCAL
jgi:hypothetical protein